MTFQLAQKYQRAERNDSEPAQSEINTRRDLASGEVQVHHTVRFYSDFQGQDENV